ncbi:hypothetical protein [Olsenella phocaeensis]
MSGADEVREAVGELVNGGPDPIPEGEFREMTLEEALGVYDGGGQDAGE